MKIKILIIIGFIVTGFPDLKSQTIKTISISGGIGIPKGKENYPKNNLFDFALFSNNSSALFFGLDLILKNSGNFEYGIHTNFSTYLGWKTDNISNRFANSSLKTFDIGPLCYFDILKFSNDNQFIKILVVPFISYMKLTNQKSTYNFYSESTLDNGQHALLTFQKNESIYKLSQILPGIYVAIDWSKYVNETSLIFIRPGLTYMLTKPDGYPDKYVLMPSLAIGYTFNYSRNKWFFIKGN
jgi:hypothetical protein